MMVFTMMELHLRCLSPWWNQTRLGRTRLQQQIDYSFFYWLSHKTEIVMEEWRLLLLQNVWFNEINMLDYYLRCCCRHCVISRWKITEYSCYRMPVVSSKMRPADHTRHTSRIGLDRNLIKYYDTCSFTGTVANNGVLTALSNFSPTRGFVFAYWKIVKFIFQH